jgi:hypothetical protein
MGSLTIAFSSEWILVRVKKTRQNKIIELIPLLIPSAADKLQTSLPEAGNRASRTTSGE